MKKFVNWNSLKWPVLSLMLLGAMSACNKNKDEMPRTPAAGFMAFNLALDKPSVGFSLSGSPVTKAPLSYSAFTGVYLPVNVGATEVKSYDYTNNATIATSNANLADSMYYSAFLIGANGNYSNLVVHDDFETVTPVAGKAWIRYINAVPDSTAIPSITIDENTGNAPYGTVSNFSQVDVGNVDISVTNGGSVSANRTITTQENKIYTVLFVGLPNQTDTTKSVMIKYIENGTAAL